MHVLTWILTGILIGWASRLVAGQRPLGLLGDLSIGLLGGVVGGWLFRLLEITAPQHGPAHVVVAVIGATASIAAARLLVRATRRAAARAPEVALAVQDLEARVSRLGELERRALSRVLHRERVTRDTTAEFEEQLTLGERTADRIAIFGGSWTFIIIFAGVVLAWIAYNVERPVSFDPYPFILLNLLLSCLAALQAPVIMMSQNRMAAKDRLDARHDYEVNLKAEMEIMQLHAKLDELQQSAWKQLLVLQERQIEALRRIEQGLEATLGRGSE